MAIFRLADGYYRRSAFLRLSDHVVLHFYSCNTESRLLQHSGNRTIAGSVGLAPYRGPNAVLERCRFSGVLIKMLGHVAC